MSLLSKPELVKMAVEISTKAELDPSLVCAHIDVRSQWESGRAVPTAISYLARQSFPDPMESEYRSVQWGLMAIGGEFARQEEYQGPLPALIDPSHNLRVGCSLFRRLMRSTDLSRASVEALTGWNRENSRELAAQTLGKIEAYRELLARMPDSLQTFQRDDTILPQVRSQIEGNPLWGD